MAKRMLVDATHPEETRVVVVNGNRLEELDFETASRKQLKGNIYLAKVIRVEPSLQAAFVEYGGNRHGFLAFSEIHPDYYRIPVADREALMREQQELEDEREARALARAERDADGGSVEDQPGDFEVRDEVGAPSPAPILAEGGDSSAGQDNGDAGYEDSAEQAADDTAEPAEAAGDTAEGVSPLAQGSEGGELGTSSLFQHSNGLRRSMPAAVEGQETVSETVRFPGEDDVEEDEDEGPANGETAGRERAPRRRPMKSYKIQEVIKRRQILLVQVTKEERGNKGAALTTYLSLPGRYAVLMPNTPRGGGISRKITNPADRKRLKEMLEEFDIPTGMSVILRTAGIERSKPEVRRDLEYLMRLWDSIRETTLQSVAPALIYEEANLIKRSIRDLYANDFDEIHVEGEEGYRTAKDFMRMLMPSHAKKIQLYKDEAIPLFHRFQVEGAIEAMFNPVVQLKSGGYIVINQTEALVAIDVNSGRSTKERNIEETALKTNLEAADEVARQLRLRDLAGLIVIDFIDMEDSRNNAAVEKRLKEAMRADRARIQLGRISAFGLLELSRQRLRPSLQEINFERCPHCQGTGMVRSLESAALAVLRAIEEEGIRRRSAEVTVTCATSVTLYILNHKREVLADIERRHGLRVYLMADDHLNGPDHRLERLRARQPGDDVAAAAPVQAEKVFAQTERHLEAEAAEEAMDAAEEEEAEASDGAQAGEANGGNGDRDRSGRRRRRRRRRGGERGDGRFEANGAEGSDSEADAEGAEASADEGQEASEGAEAQEADEGAVPGETAAEAAERRRRRRGKRGGRRRGRGRFEGDGVSAEGAEGAEGGDEGTAEDGAEPVADDLPAATADVAPVVETAEPVLAAEAAPAETVTEPVAEAAAPAEEPKPKKRPSRSRKKVAEPAAEETAAPAAEAPAPVVADAVASEAPAGEEPAPAKPKRPSRSRKKVAPAAEAPAETAIATETVAVAEPPAPENQPAFQDAPPDVSGEPATEPPAPAAEAAPEEPPANPHVVVNPPVEAPKRGWWSRK
ncbi:ribonuclease E/G [Aerophototrophica crusticola]|uniref:Ribonuclease E n=1 Tax=Aerophototrophica crusticola TaxID=1709002 RepID=A0A858R537_9PROT|nr:ribonuclease E/G [Rhodospirillaceae bacterium B3]